VRGRGSRQENRRPVKSFLDPPSLSQKNPGTENFSAPNGVVVSEDGRHVFVAASTGMCIYRVTRGGTTPEVLSAKVGGFPDNVPWSADGKSILAAVHTEDPEKFVAAQVASVKIGGSMFATFMSRALIRPA
jgi:sugar lactone lactonase YvrE